MVCAVGRWPGRRLSRRSPRRRMPCSLGPSGTMKMSYWSVPIRKGKTPWPSCGLSGPMEFEPEGAAHPLRARAIPGSASRRSGTIWPATWTSNILPIAAREIGQRHLTSKGPSADRLARTDAPDAVDPDIAVAAGTSKRHQPSPQRDTRPTTPGSARKRIGARLVRAPRASARARSPRTMAVRWSESRLTSIQPVVPSGSWIWRQSLIDLDHPDRQVGAE